MSKLYLSADTDMIRALRNARANRDINLKLGYDEDDYYKKIKVDLHRAHDDIDLTIFDTESKKMIVCKGTIADGFFTCDITRKRN